MVFGFAQKRTSISLIGIIVVTFAGLALWKSVLGEPWVNASYDYLFRFSERSVTNEVVVVLMDNESFDHFGQTRGQPWDRALHVRLLNKLADDDCQAVVFDSFFSKLRDPMVDSALAEAMGRVRKVVLMAEQTEVTDRKFSAATPLLPESLFLKAAKTNWGVAWLDPDLDLVVRRHWPFPSPGLFPSLPEATMLELGMNLDRTPQERWFRYYSPSGPWPKLSYKEALAQPPHYFRNKIVFVGTAPKTSMVDASSDAFSTPYTRWTGEATGGVELMLTGFLNLANSDWLRRLPWAVEGLALVLSGIVIGIFSARAKLWGFCIFAVGFAVAVSISGLCLSHYSNFWFPWLLIVGVQLPCAVVWTFAVKLFGLFATLYGPKGVSVRKPKTPGYKLFGVPIGEGAYGKIWLARNRQGGWFALKAIYLDKFEDHVRPYEREFNGINRYKKISHEYADLLRVDFVSENLNGYFYYVMELADSCDPEWQRQPEKYKPLDLANACARLPDSRLPVRECIEVGLVLTAALEFLHQRGLAHRDVKPQNVIFVGGRPKLADFGLVGEIRPTDEIKTYIGTPGYMPPPPEPPGTPAADIYALGILLYVISTGRKPAFFPEIATTLVDNQAPDNFMVLNRVILRACHVELAERFSSAIEMHQALLAAKKLLGAG